MKMKKRAGAVITAALLALSLAACGTQSADSGFSLLTSQVYRTDAEAARLTPAEVLTRSDEAMKGNTDIHAKMQMVMRMSIKSNTVDTYTKLDMVLHQSPLALKMSGEMQISEQGKTGKRQTESYVVEEGGVYRAYSKVGDEWQQTTLDDASSAALQQTMRSFDISAYTRNASRFRNAGVKTDGGRDVVVLQGELTGEDMVTALKASGADTQLAQQLAQAGLTLESISTKSGMTITCGYDVETMRPVDMTIDMTGYIQEMMNTLVEAQKASGASANEIKVDQYLVDTRFEAFDEDVPAVTVPQEARQGKEVVTSSVQSAVVSSAPAASEPSDPESSSPESSALESETASARSSAN